MELNIKVKKNPNFRVLKNCYLGDNYKIDERYGIFIPILCELDSHQNYSDFDDEISEKINFEETNNVSTLSIQNQSNKSILFLNGEIFEGAKQDRVLNETNIVEPFTKTIVSVSCIEQNRWSFNRRNFTKSKYMTSYSTKNVKDFSINSGKMRLGPQNDHQHKIWNNIRAKEQAFKVDNINGSEKQILETLDKDLDNIKKQFSCLENQVGLVAIQRDYIGFDLLPSFASYKKFNERLIQSHLTESLELIKQNNYQVKGPRHMSIAQTILDDFFSLLVFEKGTLRSINKRFQEQIYFNRNKSFTASAYNYDEKIAHLTGFQYLNK